MLLVTPLRMSIIMLRDEVSRHERITFHELFTLDIEYAGLHIIIENANAHILSISSPMLSPMIFIFGIFIN